jgi:hypothetical protein
MTVRKLTAAERRELAERAARITTPPPSVPHDYPVAMVPERTRAKRNRVAAGTRFDATDRTGEPVQSARAISLSTGFELAAGYGYSGIGVREGRHLIFGDMADVDYAEPGMAIGLFALLDATRHCAGLDLEELIILDGLADRGLDQKQVAEETGMSEATISRRVQSIRKKARAIKDRLLKGHATHARDWRRDWERLSISERWTYHYRITAKHSGGPSERRMIPHPDWQRLEAERIEMDRAFAVEELAEAVADAELVEMDRATAAQELAAWRRACAAETYGPPAPNWPKGSYQSVIPLKPDAPIPTWHGMKKAA